MKFDFACLLLVVITPVVQTQSQPANRPGALERELLRTDSLFEVYAQEHGIAASFLAFMADSATLFPGGEEPVSGREAITKHMKEYPPGAKLLWWPKKAEVARSSDLGYTWGTSEYRDKDSTGKPIVSYGKYVTIWKKQADGTWKFIIDIGNRSPSPQQR